MSRDKLDISGRNILSIISFQRQQISVHHYIAIKVKAIVMTF